MHKYHIQAATWNKFISRISIKMNLWTEFSPLISFVSWVIQTAKKGYKHYVNSINSGPLASFLPHVWRVVFQWEINNRIFKWPNLMEKFREIVKPFRLLPLPSLFCHFTQKKKRCMNLNQSWRCRCRLWRCNQAEHKLIRLVGSRNKRPNQSKA